MRQYAARVLDPQEIHIEPATISQVMIAVHVQ
jgi:hypothetical protein